MSELKKIDLCLDWADVSSHYLISALKPERNFWQNGMDFVFSSTMALLQRLWTLPRFFSVLVSNHQSVAGVLALKRNAFIGVPPRRYFGCKLIGCCSSYGYPICLRKLTTTNCIYSHCYTTPRLGIAKKVYVEEIIIARTRNSDWFSRERQSRLLLCMWLEMSRCTSIPLHREQTKLTDDQLSRPVGRHER